MKQKIRTISFCIVLVVVFMGFLFGKPRTFSDMENRNLAQFPTFSVDSFFSGEFTSGIESYAADQIIAKDFLVTCQVGYSRLLGQSEVNGVYFGKDGYLIQDFHEPGQQLTTNLNMLEAFVKKHGEDIPCYMLLAPNASYVYQDKLPRHGVVWSQAEVIEQIKEALRDEVTVVDVADTLMAHKDEQLYFKTDHHWNANGAYYAYEQLCEEMRVEKRPKLDENIKQIDSQGFLGSLYSKAPAFSQEADVLTYYENTKGNYEVAYLDEKNRVSDSFYETDMLKEKDQYKVFFGGNHSVFHMKSNGLHKKKVLVLKDSYANIMLPYLADTFTDITVIDLRYYNKRVDLLMEEEKFDVLLLCYNVDFLTTDKNFTKLR